ncbi:Glyco-tran-10-N domain-containing protein [Aphelenchoides bicaudatus]|nr:Glyco-tran-10-N domain-containing protein [Aphelenchoides bicaudatus]
MSRLSNDQNGGEVVWQRFNAKLSDSDLDDEDDMYFDRLEYKNLTPEMEKVAPLSRVPVILYWNEYFFNEFKNFVLKDPSKISCPYKCNHTMDRKLGSIADIRNPKALNIYYTLEPPYLTYSKYHRPNDVNPNYFNYTGSYRTRSYIYYPYDKFVPLDGKEKPEEFWTDKQVEEKVAGKTKAALIAMSNCGAESARHEYVRKLKEFINVTRVGKCDGNVQCDKDSAGKALRVDMDCMQQLNDEHHFYLAFENSVCPEYTSEKFWRMKQLIVPVVLSRAAVPKHVPQDTYIAASDFDSPKDLANFLKQLMEDKEQYKKYFGWTKLYKKTRLTEEEIKVSCQLCKLAHKQPTHQIANYKGHWTKHECVEKFAVKLIDNSPDNINSARCAEKRLEKLMLNSYRDRNLNEF